MIDGQFEHAEGFFPYRQMAATDGMTRRICISGPSDLAPRPRRRLNWNPLSTRLWFDRFYCLA